LRVESLNNPVVASSTAAPPDGLMLGLAEGLADGLLDGLFDGDAEAFPIKKIIAGRWATISCQ
jgi:hypothetical protein